LVKASLKPSQVEYAMRILPGCRYAPEVGLALCKVFKMAFKFDELRERAFERAALALFSFWEEQKDNHPRSAAVHSRLFETLIYNEYIELNEKAPGRKYPEHVVPCAYIRNLAFDMFWDGKTTNDVAAMIGRLLRIAYISDEEATKLDAVHKYTMPEGWTPENDSILRRLEDAGIQIVGKKANSALSFVCSEQLQRSTASETSLP
jgi:hypothetical protein